MLGLFGRRGKSKKKIWAFEAVTHGTSHMQCEGIVCQWNKPKTVWDVRKGRGKSFRRSHLLHLFTQTCLVIFFIFFTTSICPLLSNPPFLLASCYVQILSFIRYWWIIFLWNPKHQHSSCQKKELEGANLF